MKSTITNNPKEQKQQSQIEDQTKTVQEAYLYYSRIINRSKYNALLLLSRDGHSQLWVPPSAIKKHDIKLKQIQVEDWFIPRIKWELLSLPSKKTGAIIMMKEGENKNDF